MPGFVGRAVLTLGGTAAGIAALLSFKTHPPTSEAAAAAASTPGTQTTQGTQGTGVPATEAPTTAAPATKAPAAKAPGTTASATASAGTATQTRSFTGAVENTAYGPMQVKITLTGQRITAVTVLQETNDGAESQQIDSFSIPTLTSETLTAQSARIDTVSGATATSTGYIQSLQSAIDQA